MAAQVPSSILLLLPSVRRCLLPLAWKGRETTITTTGRALGFGARGGEGGCVGAESIRYLSDAGSGAGKGGGSGGTIRSAGGSVGKRSVVQEEEFFKKEQAREIKALRDQLTAMQKGKIEYHQKQLERHLSQIKKHEEQMAKDNDPKHKIHMESHKESAEAHMQYIKKLDKGRKKE